MGATSPGIAKIALPWTWHQRSEEHTSELQSQSNLVCRLLLEKKKFHPATPARKDSMWRARYLKILMKFAGNCLMSCEGGTESTATTTLARRLRCSASSLTWAA